MYPAALLTSTRRTERDVSATRSSRQIQAQEGDVVLVGGRARERDDLGKQAIEQIGTAQAAVDRREQPLLAEHPLGPAGLGDAVGVEKQGIAGAQRVRRLLARDVKERGGKDRPGGIEQHRLGSAGADDRLGVPRVDVPQLAPPGIDARNKDSRTGRDRNHEGPP